MSTDLPGFKVSFRSEPGGNPIEVAGVGAKGKLRGRITVKLPGTYRPNEDGSIKENLRFSTSAISYRVDVVLKYNKILGQVVTGDVGGLLGSLGNAVTSGGRSLGERQEKPLFKAAEGTIDF